MRASAVGTGEVMKINTRLRRSFHANRRLTACCCLIVICWSLFLTLGAQAASLQLVADDWGTNGVPTNVTMYIYVPDNLAPNPPILVLLHYWGGGASGVFAEAVGGGLVAACDQYGFIMVVPQTADCWDYGSAQSLTHDGGGQTEAIAHMVSYTVNTYHANRNRVYVTGTSCGGMMTEALLGVYPDIFKAGAEFAGVPIGGAWTPVTHTPQQWGDLARACYPGYSGHRPRVQLWHGTADGTVNYTNQLEAIMQWGNVLGLSSNPTYSNTVTIAGITNQWTHPVWVDGCSNVMLEAWSEVGGGHGTDANLNAQYVIPFLGLDKVGPVEPEDPDVYCGHTQRGRPHLNAARSTFVGDNGQGLRGPFTSTEWTSASTDVAMIKGMGFNALHLYAECFDARYPTNGSTAPGYSVANVDCIVAQTRTNGLYLIMTIGNGAWNGSYNAAYITNFWKFYAARYANETHVLFEIQNEPVAWGPPYSATNATPPGALDMEVAAYRTIRACAPNTPVLLFTYAVLGDSGGASAALSDIHAFNTNVFGNANAVWANEAVGFHGYAGASATSNAVSQIIAAGYPCFMTEFGGGVWGTGVGGLDAYAVADLERLGVSWLTFQYIPPGGVSDDVTDPERYEDIVNWTGLSWTPDFGNWPPVRGPYGNGGFPWTTPDYANGLLTGSLRIEAENFDAGGEGVAYHELTTTNVGGQYRTNEAVDIESTTDAGGGYDVTGTAAGEWLEYTIYVSEPGLYNLGLRVAGTSAGTVQVLTGGINGTNLTGAWAVPATGGAQTWTTISNTVFLTPGQQVLHLGILAGGFNLNWLRLSPVATGIIADGTYKVLNNASALAVTGGSGDNTVSAGSYAGSTAQQWNLQHIGGGEYKITCVNNGWSLVSGSGFYWWISNHYLVQPAAGGCYRLVAVGSGYDFESTVTNQSVIDEQVSSGGANQQWAILPLSAPAFPSGLNALAVSSTQISLSWNAVAGPTSYNVKRSTTSGGPYTTIAAGVATPNYTDTGFSLGVRYFYVVSAVVGGVESLNSAEAALRYPKLTGAIIGTPGSWNNSGNTVSNVFDGDLNTFFDAPDPGNGDWAGLDFGVGVSNVITQINYCPRSGYESRMVGGVFQGANQANFSDAVTLRTVAAQPVAGAFTSASITNATAFRYVRYLSPNGGYGNVAELEFYGYQMTATLSPTLGALVHRYSFNESGGASVADSAGGPAWNGTLPAGGVLSGGALTLSSASQQYVSLPADIVSSLTNLTIMAWVNLNSVSSWSRVFDVGNNTTTNMFLTPQNGWTSTLRFAITTNGAGSEQQINCSSTLSTGAWHQVAVTLSGPIGILYLDGAAVGTNSGMTLNPSTLGSTVNDYLGKSQYADPYLDGSLDEFRIYNVALSSAEMAATAALGPGQLLSTNSPTIRLAAAGTNLMMSWPVANAGFTVQWRTNLTLGTWANITSPMPQIGGSQWQVSLPVSASSPARFYRLVK